MSERRGGETMHGKTVQDVLNLGLDEMTRVTRGSHVLLRLEQSSLFEPLVTALGTDELVCDEQERQS